LVFSGELTKRKTLCILEVLTLPLYTGLFMLFTNMSVTISAFEKQVNTCEEYQDLSLLSKKDKQWDRHKLNSERIASIYSELQEFEKYASRVMSCAGRLGFVPKSDKETGEIYLRLWEVFFCRVRSCPICQWRRSMMWKAKFYEALPQLIELYPKSRWLFLTLTVRNCDVAELRSKLNEMQVSWKRLVKKAVWKDVLGWVRTVEITRSDSAVGNAHPHFHILLMVNSGYFGKNYVSTENWGKAWQEAMRLDYIPQVNVQGVRSGGKLVKSVDVETMKEAVGEVLKYAVKPSDILNDADEENAAKWFIELTRQTHKLRFIASGGILKDVFKDEKSNNDLIHTVGDQPSVVEEEEKLFFRWNSSKKKYRRKFVK
jgi:plasmid rolling circle replication initiator protein Rep